MISLNKRNKAILLLALVLFVLLPFEFTWHDTALDYMSFDDEPVSAVLFWLFYISVAVTAIAAVFNRYDITKLTSLVSIVFIVLLIVLTINSVHSRNSFIENLFRCTQFGYVYVVITAGMCFLSRMKLERDS